MVGFDPPAELHAVHAWHLYVQDSEVVRYITVHGGAELFEGLRTALDARGLHSPGRELLLEDRAVGPAVVYDQRPPSGEIRGDRRCGTGMGRLLVEGHGKREGAADA